MWNTYAYTWYTYMVCSEVHKSRSLCASLEWRLQEGYTKFWERAVNKASHFFLGNCTWNFSGTCMGNPLILGIVWDIVLECVGNYQFFRILLGTQSGLWNSFWIKSFPLASELRRFLANMDFLRTHKKAALDDDGICQNVCKCPIWFTKTGTL